VAKATGAAITAAYFREPVQAASLSRVSDAKDVHRAAFEQLDQIASFYQIAVDKVTQEDASPELAILKHARRGRFNLIILGVSKRAGENLSYGGVADTLLDTADRSFVFIET
jgi:nucleotide-binding universal stress UspA family protein